MTRKKFIHIRYRHHLHRPNYIVHISNKATLFSNIFKYFQGWLNGSHGYRGPAVLSLIILFINRMLAIERTLKSSNFYSKTVLEMQSFQLTKGGDSILNSALTSVPEGYPAGPLSSIPSSTGKGGMESK